VRVITNGTETPNENVTFFRQAAPLGAMPGLNVGGGNFSFGSAASQISMNHMEMKLVKGKPYSADVVNEHIQTLGDGNRIAQKSSSFIARDSEGRTRQVAAVQAFGPFAEAMKDMPKSIIIFDPVAGANYALNPSEKTATKIPVLNFNFADLKSRSQNGMLLNETKIIIQDGSGVTKTTTSTSGPGVKLISGGELTSKVTKKVQPNYPAVAKAARAQGAVLIKVVVNEKGEVITEDVIGGHPLLKEAALEAAKQWKFQPTEINGQPVKVQGTLTFNFTLKDDPANPAPTASEGENILRIIGPDGKPEDTHVIVRSVKNNWDVKNESLGKQMIEGVQCDGSKTVTTIPAGEVGNDNPILITTENWISSDLQVTVLRKFNDPRYGEDIYRLTNIRQVEPEKELFKVPSDYKIIEEAMQKMENIEILEGGADGKIQMKMRMKKNNEEKQ
jgi:TonB family protein